MNIDFKLDNSIARHRSLYFAYRTLLKVESEREREKEGERVELPSLKLLNINRNIWDAKMKKERVRR